MFIYPSKNYYLSELVCCESLCGKNRKNKQLQQCIGAAFTPILLSKQWQLTRCKKTSLKITASACPENTAGDFVKVIALQNKRLRQLACHVAYFRHAAIRAAKQAGTWASFGFCYFLNRIITNNNKKNPLDNYKKKKIPNHLWVSPQLISLSLGTSKLQRDKFCCLLFLCSTSLNKYSFSQFQYLRSKTKHIVIVAKHICWWPK